MPERVKVKLKVPVQHGSETVAELAFRPGVIGDMQGVSVSDSLSMDDLMKIASRLCGQPLEVIKGIGEEDAGIVLGAAKRFFMRCLGTGDGP